MKVKHEIATSQCLCGSGEPYEKCCKGKINPNENEKVHKHFMDELDKRRRHYRHLCLHPKQNECCAVKTHAHTISQYAVLSLIAEKSEVLMPVVYGVTNEFKMQSMGIESQATKFHCFCETHDAMFYPIDQRAVKLDDYSLFLYAYRIFASTYYKIIRELDCYESLYQKYDVTYNPLAILLNLITKNSLAALNWYKERFDNSILDEKYNCLEHAIITLEYRTYFAAATCFGPMFDVFGNQIIHSENDLPIIYISVIPDENRTRLIFSWFKEDHPVYGFFGEQLKIAPTKFILKYLNNLLPLNCENMTISPLLWDKWDTTAKKDFLKVAHNHLKNENMKTVSATYFSERTYSLFLRI